MTLAARFSSPFITRRWSSLGWSRTVWSVTITGIVKRSSSARICSPGRAAENSVFVLDPDRLRAACLDIARGGEIGHAIVLVDRPGYGGGIVIPLRPVVHRIHVDLQAGEAVGQRGVSVRRICRNAALARQKVTDQSNVSSTRLDRRRGPFRTFSKANAELSRDSHLPERIERNMVAAMLHCNKRILPTCVNAGTE